MIKHKKASEIYGKQNTLLHKAFARAGMPYKENKETWLELMTDIAGRSVSGLSELSLLERHQLITHLQQRGIRLYAPAVPVKIRGWKKGDPDVEYEFRYDEDPQIRMVYAIWAEMGYEPKKLRGLVLKRFGKSDPRWLSNTELNQLVNLLSQRAKQKGLPGYYRRKA